MNLHSVPTNLSHQFPLKKLAKTRIASCFNRSLSLTSASHQFIHPIGLSSLQKGHPKKAHEDGGVSYIALAAPQKKKMVNRS